MEDLFNEREANRKRANLIKQRAREEKLRKVKIRIGMGAVGVIIFALTAWCIFGGKNKSDGSNSKENSRETIMVDATIDKDIFENTDTNTETESKEEPTTEKKKYGYGDEVYSDGKFVVCIDAGHGGDDTGCIGADGSKESEDDLKLAMLIKHQLEQNGVKVVMTRSADVWVDLEDRPYIANMSNADLLVSIHRNADEDSSAKGVEAWISHKENDNSNEIGFLILEKLEKVGISRNRGVRMGSMTSSESDYTVNGKSSMPSVLLEMGFMSSPTDNRLFKNNISDYATAIAEAVLQWSQSQPY